MSWIYPHPLEVTNVLDKYYLTYLVPAKRCLFWKLASVTQTKTIIFPGFSEPIIR